MAQDVLCEVNNCKFWANGNKCSAEAIYVVSHKGKHASTTEETDCKTFDPEVCNFLRVAKSWLPFY